MGTRVLGFRSLTHGRQMLAIYCTVHWDVSLAVFRLLAAAIFRDITRQTNLCALLVTVITPDIPLARL